MTPQSFLAAIEKKQPPALEADVLSLERSIGGSLPADYRAFLVACNGGYVGGELWFTGLTPAGEAADAGIHHIGGFRTESHFSLAWSRECYEGRIPADLMWIMDDPFGNAICIGVCGTSTGKVFFWDHENEPDSQWDGSTENAGNVVLLANSFGEFINGIRPTNRVA